MGWTAKPGQLLGVEQTLVLSSLFVSMEMRDLGINGGKKEQKRGRGGKGSIHEGLLGGKEPSLLNLCPETGSSVLWEMLHLGYQTHEGRLPGAWLQSVSVTTLLWFATPLWRWGGVYQSPELPEDLWELSAHQTASGFGEEEILLCFSSSLVVTPSPPPRPASCPVDIWSFICMVYLVSCFRTVPPLLQIICFDRIFLEAPLLDKVQSLQGLAWKIWICTVHWGLLSDLRLLLLPWYGLFFPSWALISVPFLPHISPSLQAPRAEAWWSSQFPPSDPTLSPVCLLSWKLPLLPPSTDIPAGTGQPSTGPRGQYTGPEYSFSCLQ